VVGLLSVAAPAGARVRVFVGGAIGVPAYPYPYYPYYPYYGYPAPYAVEPYPTAPPAAWVPGHWEWRYDPSGRPYRAWVPAHLQ
jgi:hypothetical protein